MGTLSTTPDIEVFLITADAMSRPEAANNAGGAASRATTRQPHTYSWVAGLWVVVAAFAVVTAVRSHQVDIPLRDPSGSIFAWRLALSLTLLVMLSLLEAAVRTGRRGWTLGRVGAALRERWTTHRVILAVSGLLAYHIVYVCYRNLKSWVAFKQPRDEELLRLDKDLFAGHSPAVLLHDLFGQQLAARMFEVIYESFSYLVPVSFVAALVFAPKIRDGYVFLSSAVWVWILGLGSYYLVPSLGPFTSASSEFAGLDAPSIAGTQAKYLAQREQLLAHPDAADSFASISAFASLHVGFTCLILLMVRYYGLRVATKMMAIYLVAVMTSTIYLGWHFVVDVPAGLILAAAAVALGRWTTYPRGGRSA